MAIDFNSLISDDQKRELLTQRINQFAIEAYQHNLNRDIATQVGDIALANQSNEAIVTLETAIEFHQTELEALGN